MLVVTPRAYSPFAWLTVSWLAKSLPICARPIDRAIPGGLPRRLCSSVFESAPDQLIGRYVCTGSNNNATQWFQSAPDQLIGRYSRRAGSWLAIDLVSIRARPIDRAIRDGGARQLQQGRVSIRARPIDRAIRCRRYPERSALPFQSAPDQLIGRYPRGSRSNRPQQGFNPRPTN